MRKKLIVLALFALMVVPCVAARGSHEPLLENWDFNISSHFGTYSIRVATRGDIELTEDDSAVARMSPDAKLYIRETRGFTTRELRDHLGDKHVCPRLDDRDLQVLPHPLKRKTCLGVVDGRDHSAGAQGGQLTRE